MSLLKADNICAGYDIRGGLFSTVQGRVRAVDDVSLHINAGEVVALVGESGCGKSTLGRALLGLETIESGSLSLNDHDIDVHNPKAWKCYRRHFQMIFQDPYSSLNPRLTVGEAIAEPMLAHRILKPALVDQRVCELLSLVELDPELRHRFPHAFSGGQRQRISIARALGLNPQLIICDEIVSALDVSVQAQVLTLLLRLKKELHLAYLFISHDLSLVQVIADRIMVMYLGEVVESGPTQEVFSHPRHPYTRALLDAIPTLDRTRPPLVLKGEIPSASHKPTGCSFASRCPKADEQCLGRPSLTEDKIQNPHSWACHHPLPQSISP